ncbi:carbonic anhydrase [Flagelloscypha sp. PMI_526]|nr:carbonic anhydrase [Flagelloscypha sp. PMI_526]
MDHEPNHVHFLEWNKRYIEKFGDTGKLSIVPKKHLTILTCMDTRVNPQSILGLADGDVLTIRNAGGTVSDDVLRTFAIAQHMAGAREIAVIHHTGCGGTLFDNDLMQANVAAKTPAGVELAKRLTFPGFGEAGPEGTTKRDVQLLKENPMLLEGTVVTGWVYETHTGRIYQVA